MVRSPSRCARSTSVALCLGVLCHSLWAILLWLVCMTSLFLHRPQALTVLAANNYQKPRFCQRCQRGSVVVCDTLCCRSRNYRFVYRAPLNFIKYSHSFSVVVAIISDRLRLRGVVMLFTLPIAIIGYAAIANINSPRVQYGMTFLMATGQYASVPCILVWLSNNSAGHYKRATTSALQLAIANAGGFVSSKLPTLNLFLDH